MPLVIPEIFLLCLDFVLIKDEMNKFVGRRATAYASLLRMGRFILPGTAALCRFRTRKNNVCSVVGTIRYSTLCSVRFTILSRIVPQSYTCTDLK